MERDESEREQVETESKRSMSDDELRKAETSSDPATRIQAYQNAKEQLAKLDPTSPNAGADIATRGWTPSGKDIERVRQDIEDAKSAGSSGYTPEAFRSLASDPARGGRVTEKGREERAAGLDSVRRGEISGPLTRDSSGRAEFIDSKGKPWDVKSFRSDRPNGFDQRKSADKVDDELTRGENVIVNTAKMSDSDVAKLQAEGAKRGWGSRVVYASSVPNFCPVTTP